MKLHFNSLIKCTAAVFCGASLFACNNLDELEDRVDSLDSRITALENQLPALQENIDAVHALFEGKDILIKNIDESASIGLTPDCQMTLSRKSYEKFHDTAMKLNSKHVLVQEFIEGMECEVLVVQYQGQYFALDPIEIVFSDGQAFMDSGTSNDYAYSFKLLTTADVALIRQAAVTAAEQLDITDYARFDFRIQDGKPYLFDIAGTPYTIRHSSIAYLFDQYGLKYEDIYKVIVTCMLSNYRDA